MFASWGTGMQPQTQGFVSPSEKRRAWESNNKNNNSIQYTDQDRATRVSDNYEVMS